MRQVADFLIVVTLGLFLLSQGSTLFIPIAYAMFIAFLLYPLCGLLEKKGWGRGVAVSMSVFIGLILSFVIIAAFGVIIVSFANEWPVVQEKLNELITKISITVSGYLGWSDKELHEKIVAAFSGKSGELLNAGKAVFYSVSEGILWMVLIPVYVFLILFYRQKLVDSFLQFVAADKRQTFREVLELSIHTYFSFIKGMAIVYLMVGILNSLGLLLIGVPHPFFFGFLTAIMTFIPYLGILLAGSLPVVYAWMTFATIWHPLAVVAVFAFVQYLEANVIFPWIVGSKLNMNTLSTLVVIITGGILWGASGMILFVPIAAILKLIADRMEGKAWKALAGFLGNDA